MCFVGLEEVEFGSKIEDEFAVVAVGMIEYKLLADRFDWVGIADFGYDWEWEFHFVVY